MPRHVPLRLLVAIATVATAAAASPLSAAAAAPTGGVYGSGFDADGQLGNGTYSDYNEVFAPEPFLATGVTPRTATTSASS